MEGLSGSVLFVRYTVYKREVLVCALVFMYLEVEMIIRFGRGISAIVTLHTDLSIHLILAHCIELIRRVRSGLVIDILVNRSL